MPPSDEAARPSAPPPWLDAANALGVSFEHASAQPPWLQAAVEQGVVFYDPEGREIEVPASKVPAFTEGLDKVRAFEQSWSINSASGSGRPPEGVSACASLPQAADKDGTKAGDEPSRNSQLRVDLKAYVQKMYFAFLREGLEPNEAAALAIRQAAQGALPPASSQSCSTTAKEHGQQKSGEQRQEEVTVSA